MTAFGLTLWLYERTGSALETALLSVCTYAPYVAMTLVMPKLQYQSTSGLLTDRFTTPLMTELSADSLLVRCFGSAKGGGAALTIFLLWVLGVAICLIFGRILRRCTFREA